MLQLLFFCLSFNRATVMLPCSFFITGICQSTVTHNRLSVNQCMNMWHSILHDEITKAYVYAWWKVDHNAGGGVAEITMSLCPSVMALSRRYLLNCSTFCNQTVWWCIILRWSVMWLKTNKKWLLFSKSWSQWGLIIIIFKKKSVSRWCSHVKYSGPICMINK